MEKKYVKTSENQNFQSMFYCQKQQLDLIIAGDN